MTERTASRLAWALAGLALAIVSTTATLVLLNRSSFHSLNDANPIEVTLPIGYALMGAVVSSRQRRNPIGWMFLAIALFAALPGLGTQYVLRSHLHAGGILPLASWGGWLIDWPVSVIFPAGVVAFLFLLFPTGRLASPRWRWLARLAVALSGIAVFASMTQPDVDVQTAGIVSVRNPIGITALGGLWESAFGAIAWLLGTAILAASLVSLFLRFRRSAGEERQQLKWLVYAATGTVAAILLHIPFALAYPDISQIPFDLIIILGFGVAVPVACGIAILRYGLYEIDVVINKTVVYAVLAGAFTAVYFAIVVGIGAAVGSRSSGFLTIIAAVLMAALFNPVRNRARRIANRIVYGDRATPYDVLSEFSERMAGAYDTEDVLPRMARIMAEGTGAQRAEVWLKVGAELRRSASWPADADGGPALRVSNGELPSIPGTDRSAAVRHQGELLGALAVAKAPNDPVTPVEDKLIADLAAQAGLVLRNVRLTEELRANLEELRASRQRIVAAQDEGRRRLERNIHDGAQQQLVALSVKLGLLKMLAGRDAEQATQLADDLQRESTEALENLRDLARGIYPPLLADQGLVAALEAQAHKTLIPVQVEAEGIARYSQDVEAAVYFCTLEALQNVAKYAQASRAVVRLAASNGSLTFSVADDGRGFDPRTTPRGTGLQGMADRLAALGGEMEVRSAPGQGVTVIGRISSS